MSDDPLHAQLMSISPDVDARAAYRRFSRARRVRRLKARLLTGTVVLGVVAGAGLTLAVLGRADSEITSQTLSNPSESFEVLAVGDQFPFGGHLAAAGSDQQLAMLWESFHLAGPEPTVDFATGVVAAITVPGNSCAPVFSGLVEAPHGIFTPAFTEVENVGCADVLVTRTFVIRVERSFLGNEFTLRLAAGAGIPVDVLLVVTIRPDGATDAAGPDTSIPADAPTTSGPEP